MRIKGDSECEVFSTGFNKCKLIPKSPELGLVAAEEGGYLLVWGGSRFLGFDKGNEGCPVRHIILVASC